MTTPRDTDWRRADELFEALLDVPEGQRPERLRALAGDDPGLVARVERLLAVEAGLGGFLEGAPPDLPTELAADLGTRGPAGPALSPGDRVGRYRILGVLGQGGTSTVYRAERDDGTFQQQVALKLLRADGPRDELAYRLRTEQQILATLSHPNLAKVFDGGVTEDGRPYLVVELVEGESLTRYADHRRLSIPDRLRLFTQVARAVQYAHRNLVVHRDLKPSNILATADGHVKLLDFGVAKIVDPGLEASDQTHTVTRWMTPRYAAPEQILGQPATTATDVHALGVILYELLSGRRPFGDDTENRFEVERAICEREPTRPSATVALQADGAAAALRGTEPDHLRRALGGDLDAVVLKALRKEPEGRYSSPGAMADDVDRYLAGFPVEARGGAVAYRARKFIRRHRAATAGGAAFVALLLTSLAVLTVQQAQTARERDRANQAAADAAREARNAQASIDFLADVFRGRNPNQGPNDTVTALELVDWAMERVPAELADQPEVRAELLLVLGSAYDNLGYGTRARDAMAASLELREDLHGPESEEAAEALEYLTQSHRRERDFSAALETQRAAVERIRTLYPDRDPRLARSLMVLGTVFRDVGALDSAGAYVGEAVAILSPRAEEDPGSYTDALLALAYIRRGAGALGEAEALYREGIPRLRALRGDDDPELPVHLNNLAYLLRVKGDNAGAEPLYREALAAVTEAYGRGHPSTMVVSGNLVAVLQALGRGVEADSLKSADVAAARTHWGGDHWRVGQALTGLGRLRLTLGRVGEAAAPLEAAAAIHRRVLGPDHEWTLMAEADVGAQRILSGREAEGRPALDRALAMVEGWARSDGGIQFTGLQTVDALVNTLARAGMDAEAAAFAAYLPEDWSGG